MHDAAGLGHLLQPGGDVDAIAVEIAALDHHVAEIDADAQYNALVVGERRRSPLAMPLLQLDRAGDGVHGAGELDQHAVAHHLDDAALMLRNQRRQDRPCAGP